MEYSMEIKVNYAGFFTTIQDLGRSGFQKFGVSPSGAMDQTSMVLANVLVGNSVGDAVLEMTAIGPILEFSCDSVIAMTGGNMEPKLNDKPLEMNQAYEIKAGDVLSFSFAKSGFRTYLAIAGGINVPEVMGSRSTFVKCKMGGFLGRQLKTGDCIPIIESKGVLKNINQRQVPYTAYEEDITVRVIEGPQEDYFSKNALNTFYSECYRVSEDSDRMGYKLKGKAIIPEKSADIISDGIAFGSIQIPSNGQPIVMLADRQTTGGYPKIGTVCSVDLPKLVQCKPGGKVRFKKIDVNKANALYRKQMEQLNKLHVKLNGREA